MEIRCEMVDVDREIRRRHSWAIDLAIVLTLLAFAVREVFPMILNVPVVLTWRELDAIEDALKAVQDHNPADLNNTFRVDTPKSDYRFYPPTIRTALEKIKQVKEDNE